MAYMFLYVDMNIHMIQQPRIQQQLGKKGRSCYADTHTHTHKLRIVTGPTSLTTNLS